MSKHISTHQNQDGFTLIELLMYVAVAAVITTGVSIMLVMVLGARVRNQTISEVEGQGAFIMQQIGLSIRNASAINSPATGLSGSTLSVNERTASLSPAVYTIANNIVSVTEGTGSAVALSSPNITISNLTFTNLSMTGSPSQTIRVQFTASYVNNIGRSEYAYSRTFDDTFSLR